MQRETVGRPRVSAVETGQPAQKSRERLVESRSQRPARRQMLLQEQPLARFPRLEGLQRHSRPAKKHEMYPASGILILNSRRPSLNVPSWPIILLRRWISF